MDKELTKLTKLWYEIIGVDHHKDRDCHWYINKTWSYGQEPTYTVEHYGYIGETITEDFETYAEAEAFLFGTLGEAIEGEKIWAKKVLETEEEDEYSYGNFDRARKILKVIEERRKLNE